MLPIPNGMGASPAISLVGVRVERTEISHCVSTMALATFTTRLDEVDQFCSLIFRAAHAGTHSVKRNCVVRVRLK